MICFHFAKFLFDSLQFLEDNGIDMTLCLDAQAAQVHTQEKRTRFSLSHDDGSIGIQLLRYQRSLGYNPVLQFQLVT